MMIKHGMIVVQTSKMIPPSQPELLEATFLAGFAQIPNLSLYYLACMIHTLAPNTVCLLSETKTNPATKYSQTDYSVFCRHV
jgi:hypothetical protein